MLGGDIPSEETSSFASLDLGPCHLQDDISFAINERGLTDVAHD